MGLLERRIGRRGFLLGFTALTSAALAERIVPHSQELSHSLNFITGRRVWTPERSYSPPSPEAMLSREASDKIFDSLNLTEKFPNTINKNAFHAIIQRPARIANLYFHPDEKSSSELERDFTNHCEMFFGKMLKYCDLLKVDFVATLLMFQVSGDANGSAAALKQDVTQERLRVGLSVAERLIGHKAGSLVVNAFRKLPLEGLVPIYYALPRLEGPVTIGIHDVEIVMIARSLVDLEDTLPDVWPGIVDYLRKRAPRFFSQYTDYVKAYSDFESKSEDVTMSVDNSLEARDYLQKFYNADYIRQFLLSEGEVDTYQLRRTTVFWAISSELEQLSLARMAVPDRRTLEKQALDKTVAHYLEFGSPGPFFLDQILNPKMLQQLGMDARVGDVPRKLLDTCREFEDLGNNIISTDRAIAAALVQENTEPDLEFQLLTGVAYARWLLQEVHRNQYGFAVDKLRYFDQHKLAFASFLANGNRESAPTYQLAGTRPLHKATLTFAPRQLVFQTINSFINEVYKKFATKSPEEDFKTFSKFFLNLIEERYFQVILGTNRYQIDSDKNMAEFIQSAKKFGAYSKLITPPHSNWMRALEATAGYISEMSLD